MLGESLVFTCQGKRELIQVSSKQKPPSNDKTMRVPARGTWCQLITFQESDHEEDTGPTSLAPLPKRLSPSLEL
jgi:hypothetical protein